MIDKRIHWRTLITMTMLIVLYVFVLVQPFYYTILKASIVLGLMVLLVIAYWHYIIIKDQPIDEVRLFETWKMRFFNIVDYCSIFISAILLLQIVFTCWFFPAQVNQTSMNPTLFEGDRLIVVNGNQSIDRFDIVVFRIDTNAQVAISSTEHNALWVKRVIGLPGEMIEYQQGLLYVNGEVMLESFLLDAQGDFYQGTYRDRSGILRSYNTETNDFSLLDVLDLTDLNGSVIPEGYYLLLGDNRYYSQDSRMIGLVHESYIIGEGKYAIRSFLDWIKVG